MEITNWLLNYQLVILIWGLVFFGLGIGGFPNPEKNILKIKISNWSFHHNLVISTFSSLLYSSITIIVLKPGVYTECKDMVKVRILSFVKLSLPDITNKEKNMKIKNKNYSFYIFFIIYNLVNTSTYNRLVLLLWWSGVTLLS